MNKDEILLGKKVLITAKLIRKEKHIKGGTYSKYWEKKMIPSTDGVIAGLRNLSNGEAWWEQDVGRLYDPKEFFTAAIVYTHLWRKPLYVKLEDMEEI